MAKKMDQLTMDSIAAQKAGMSYGKWKALQPRTEAVRPVVKVPEEPEDMKCVVCGKEIPITYIGSGGHNRICCSDACSYERMKERNRLYYHRKKERMMAGGKI